MNILDLLRRSGRKEYMKYEDGKIIPVKVEENKSYQEVKLTPAEQKDEIKKVIKEKVDMPGKVKRYGTIKMLKIIFSIAIVVFFGYTVKDVYIAFTDNTNIPVVDDKPTEGAPEVPDTPKETGSFTPGGDPIGTIKPPTEEQKEETEESDSKPLNEGETSTLKQAIDSSNVVNSMMVSEMAKEVSGLNIYFDNKINKFTFQKRVQASLETKLQLTQYLEERKPLFIDEGIPLFYDATASRLQNSTAMSQLILDSFNNSMTENELKMIAEEHVQVENELKEKQKSLFIQLLKDKGIEHSVDDLKGEISYTLK